MIGRLAAGLILALLAGPAAAAPKPELLDLRQPAVMAEAMKRAGYEAEVKKDAEGNPFVLSKANGVEFSADYYNCGEDGKCNSYQFRSWYKPEPIFTPALVNEWNNLKRFLRIAINAKGELNEFMDFTAVGGTTQEMLAEQLAWYSDMDGELAGFLDEKRKAK